MKRMLVLLCASILMLSAQSFAERYYCGPSEGFSIAYIYDTQENCEHWNTGYWKEKDSSIYSNCIKRNDELKEKYKNGECKKLIAKTHTFDKGKCIVELMPDTQKRIGTYCANTPAGTMDKVNAMYK